MSKCPGSLPQVQIPRPFHDTLVMPPYGRTPCKGHLWPVFDMKLKSYMETWKLQELGQCQSEKRQPIHTWALLCPQLFLQDLRNTWDMTIITLKIHFEQELPPGVLGDLAAGGLLTQSLGAESINIPAEVASSNFLRLPHLVHKKPFSFLASKSTHGFFCLNQYLVCFRSVCFYYPRGKMKVVFYSLSVLKKVWLCK